MLATDDSPGDDETPAEQALDGGKITRGERSTYRRAGHSRAVREHGRTGFHADADSCGVAAQPGDIALALVAKTEVLADDQRLAVQPVAKYPLDKFFRAELCQATVESAHHDLLHCAVAQQAKFFAQARDASGSAFRCEEFTRVRFEGQRTTDQSVGACYRLQALQQGLMAQVNAIEIADRNGNATIRAARQAAYDAHRQG